MGLYFRLAWRNVVRQRRRSLIVFLAIGIGMALMMWYDGFVAGFEEAIYANAVRVLGGNIQVHAGGHGASLEQYPLLPLGNDAAAAQAARAQPNVVAASRRIITGGMATSREGAFPVSIVGIEPEMEQPVSLVAQEVAAGRFLTAADEDVVFIGQGLAEAMNVAVGDRIALVGQSAQADLRRHTMTVAGIYDVGLPDIEKRTVYISLGEAQYLYGLRGQSTEVTISVDKLGQEPPVMRALGPQLPEAEISSWKTNFPEMEAALATKSGVMNVFSAIILMIAAIGILNLLLMAVYERTREIGLLGALGLKPRQISLLFLLEGALLGVVGLVFGIGLGLLINFTTGQVGFDFTAFANLTEYTALLTGRVYPTLGLHMLPQRALTVLLVSILASYYPAREAARSEPAEALHYV
jgi:ABC-type lipoprotein release transport system permease subunit